jgi:hypothetical protein
MQLINALIKLPKLSLHRRQMMCLNDASSAITIHRPGLPMATYQSLHTLMQIPKLVIAAFVVSSLMVHLYGLRMVVFEFAFMVRDCCDGDDEERENDGELHIAEIGRACGVRKK